MKQAVLCALLVAVLMVPSAIATDVWLDVDVAAGLHERDVDDALAMIQAFNSPELNVRGVSCVYGNSALKAGYPIAVEVLKKFGPEGMEAKRGAASKRDLGKTNEAVEAMAAALRQDEMVILALGPLTNIGSLLMLHPELHEKIETIVIVAGRRPGQRFGPESNPEAKFPDFNFENDPESMQVILDSEIAVVMAPWEISSHVWITYADLARLAKSSESGNWIAEKSQSWIGMWVRDIGPEGFNPFDTLAVGVVAHGELMRWMSVDAWIETGPNDRAEVPGQTAEKPYLFVRERKMEGVTRHIFYVYRPKPEFHDLLIERLIGEPYPE